MREAATIKGEAKALLLALIYPKSEEKMTDAEKLAFEEAILLEEKYLSEISSGGARAVKSESVGDVSVTYDLLHGAPPVRIPVSDAAYAVLMAAGILSAWV